MARIRLDSSSPIVKWNDTAAGTVFAGILRGMREGKYGLLAELETADGMRTLPVTAALARPLQRVTIGATLWITYEGTKASKDGTKQAYHAFTVEAEDADLLPPPSARASASAVAAPRPAQDTEVPF